MLITFYTNVSVVGKMRIKLFLAGYFLSNHIFQAMHFKTQLLLRDEGSSYTFNILILYCYFFPNPISHF